jgi:hypothetical protein
MTPEEQGAIDAGRDVCDVCGAGHHTSEHEESEDG